MWRLISEQPTWWKRVLEAKYLSCPRQQLLDCKIPTRNSSKIWKLCKNVIPFLAQNTFKVPKGGNNIKIGAEKIMGNQSISSQPGTDKILLFLYNKGIHYLDQISQWDTHSQICMGWTFPPIPIDLKESFDNLQVHLHSIAPIIKNGIDSFRWDPTGSNYTIQAGHQYLCNEDHLAPTWTHWKIVWKCEAIPKTKFFISTLLKGKILTIDNLQKRGIAGPS